MAGRRARTPAGQPKATRTREFASPAASQMRHKPAKTHGRPAGNGGTEQVLGRPDVDDATKSLWIPRELQRDHPGCQHPKLPRHHQPQQGCQYAARPDGKPSLISKNHGHFLQRCHKAGPPFLGLRTKKTRHAAGFLCCLRRMCRPRVPSVSAYDRLRLAILARIDEIGRASRERV